MGTGIPGARTMSTVHPNEYATPDKDVAQNGDFAKKCGDILARARTDSLKFDYEADQKNTR